VLASSIQGEVCNDARRALLYIVEAPHFRVHVTQVQKGNSRKQMHSEEAAILQCNVFRWRSVIIVVISAKGNKIQSRSFAVL
jgi:hypothetical protein